MYGATPSLSYADALCSLLLFSAAAAAAAAAAGVELIIPERGGAGVAVHEQGKEPIPSVLRNGMASMVTDTAFREQVEIMKKKVSQSAALHCTALHRAAVPSATDAKPLVLGAWCVQLSKSKKNLVATDMSEDEAATKIQKVSISRPTR
jgi:hypothetical protein